MLFFTRSVKGKENYLKTEFLNDDSLGSVKKLTMQKSLMETPQWGYKD